MRVNKKETLCLFFEGFENEMAKLFYQSPVGTLLVVCNERGLCRLEFAAKDTDMGVHEEDADAISQAYIAQTKAWLDVYFSGRSPNFTPILDITGTEFQLMVWQRLLEIPYGETVSYGMLAKEMAQQRHKPNMSAQAIGGAVGRNPVSIVVPCHRVVGANGALTGYAWGLEKKEALLKLEDWQVNRV